MNSIQLTVLVVDDDLQVASAIRRMLEHDVVISATSASKALEACRVIKFDVILCELQLPQSSGPELCEALRGRGLGGHDRVVFMSGWPAAAAAQLGKPRKTILAKPFDYRTLASALERYRATTAAVMARELKGLTRVPSPRGGVLRTVA